MTADWSFGLPRCYRAAAVVPLREEDVECLPSLLPGGSSTGEAHLLPTAGSSTSEPDLLILVINERVNDEAHVRENNAALLRALLNRSSDAEEVQGTCLIRLRWAEAPNTEIAVVDGTRCELLLGAKEGVGRARKMGADLALALFDEGRLRSPWLGSTDADAVLPESYFDVLAHTPNEGAALLFPYGHTGGQGPEEEAMAWVEAGFRYHVLGLASAGSPYAYHALGSAMAVHLVEYAAVRGFPNRQAGEDFYLLSKLARLAPLIRLRRPRILLRTRRSHRVPFGTGPALDRMLRTGAVTGVHHPRCFSALRFALSRLEDGLRDEVFGQQAAIHEPPLPEAPAEMKFAAQWAAIQFTAWERSFRECPSFRHRLGRLYERFDALSTLRFLHAVADHCPPVSSLTAAIDEARLLPTDAARNSASILATLRRKEEDLPRQVVATGKEPRPVAERIREAMGSTRYFTFD